MQERNMENRMDEQISFEIIDAVEMPKSKRGNRNGVAKYPLDKLGVGQSFFASKSERMPDPMKTLGSAVSAAKMKFATQTGTQEVTRSKRGEKNKLVFDTNGQKIMETKTVPIWDYGRKWILRPVEKDQFCGTWKAPSDGCLVQRIK
jgi:hypothetical protein